MEISQYSSFGGMFQVSDQFLLIFGVSKMNGLFTLSSILRTFEKMNPGPVPKSRSPVEVAEMEEMVLSLVLEAEANSDSVGTLWRYISTLLL